MNLQKLVGHKYLVTLDKAYEKESEPGKSSWEWWYHEVKGKYGYVYPYSDCDLAITFTSIIVANRFLGRRWKILQDGDMERTLLLPLDCLAEALKAIRPRKKRHLSEEGRNAAIARLQAFAFKKSTQSRPLETGQNAGIPKEMGDRA